jgi:site-specific recombinase XerD
MCKIPFASAPVSCCASRIKDSEASEPAAASPVDIRSKWRTFQGIRYLISACWEVSDETTMFLVINGQTSQNCKAGIDHGLVAGKPQTMKQKPRSRVNRKKAKTILRLPDLEHAKAAVLNSLTSADAQRGYGHAIDEFVDWYCSEPRLAFNRIVVLRYRSYLESRQLAPGTVNLRLGAVRRLAYEAADCGLLSSDLAAGIRRVKGVKKLGVRLGNWLTAEQAHTLWQVPDIQGLKGKRDRALLALLLTCGLRRHEAVSLRIDGLQQREEHWAIVDLVGKAGHVRTVPIPDWVKGQLDEWLEAAGIARGRIFRRVTRMGRTWGDCMTEESIWHIVKDCANRIGMPKLAPHDLRRTCARLCHASGGELEQIQFLLGHVSVQTTERYLGCKQRIRTTHVEHEPMAA